MYNPQAVSNAVVSHALTEQPRQHMNSTWTVRDHQREIEFLEEEFVTTLNQGDFTEQWDLELSRIDQMQLGHYMSIDTLYNLSCGMPSIIPF